MLQDDSSLKSNNKDFVHVKLWQQEESTLKSDEKKTPRWDLKSGVNLQ